MPLDVSNTVSLSFLKAFGLLVIGVGLLALHCYVAKLTGTGTAAPLSHTRDLLRTNHRSAAKAKGGARARLRKR